MDTAIRTFQRGMDLKEDGIINPKWETEIRLTHLIQLVSEGKISPPRPEHKPLQNTPPLPEGNPIRHEKKDNIERVKKLKDDYEAKLNIKKLYNFIKKRNPVGLMKELSDKTQEIQNVPDDKI